MQTFGLGGYSHHVRLIVYRGEPHPPLPQMTGSMVDLWAVPRLMIRDYESLLETLQKLGATQNEDQFTIMLADGFKIHHSHWEFYSKSGSAFYICIIQESLLPAYTEITGEGFLYRARSLSVEADGNDISSTALNMQSQDREVMVVKTYFEDRLGNISPENRILIRGHHSIKYLHDKLIPIFRNSTPPNFAQQIVGLKLQWGPDKRTVFPSGTAAQMRVMDLQGRDENSLFVVPILIS